MSCALADATLMPRLPASALTAPGSTVAGASGGAGTELGLVGGGTGVRAAAPDAPAAPRPASAATRAAIAAFADFEYAVGERVHTVLLLGLT